MKVKQAISGLALVVLVLGLTMVPVNAQTAVRGTFELPMTAYFGKVVLRPGHYTISYLKDMGVPFVELKGEGASITLPAATRVGESAGRSYLEVADIGGTNFIRAFNSGSSGALLVFGVNKNVQGEARRASAGRIVTVPVSPAGIFPPAAQ